MARFIIQGGRRLAGRHRPVGNKNAALPMLAACVLTDEPVRLRNLPWIEDVRTMLAILEDLGVSVTRADHEVTLCARGLRKSRLNADLCRRVRSSILFAGPLAARLGRATLYPPGGDMIGRRPLDTHFEGLDRLGITLGTRSKRSYALTCRSLKGADILLGEASVTATETILMAAVLAKGRTTIYNAACEPHVQDLCRMLNRMGARISGIGTNYLIIEGVDSLGGGDHEVAFDYIETASFIAAAVLTGGALEVPGTQPAQLVGIERVLLKLGIRWNCVDGVLHVKGGRRPVISDDHGAAIAKVEDGPWPAFPSDLMSVAIVLAVHARGTMLFFEKMFESRMYFVDRLIDMGARIVQCDPHRVVVNGPAPLYGTHLTSPDIRAGMALLLAALCARGESVIDNAQSIDRGYESIEQRLNALGAEIVREDTDHG